MRTSRLFILLHLQVEIFSVNQNFYILHYLTSDQLYNIWLNFYLFIFELLFVVDRSQDLNAAYNIVSNET